MNRIKLSRGQMQTKYLQMLAMLKEAIAENQKLRGEMQRIQQGQEPLIAAPNIAQIMEAGRGRNDR
jgi:hypothetical protein